VHQRNRWRLSKPNLGELAFLEVVWLSYFKFFFWLFSAHLNRKCAYQKKLKARKKKKKKKKSFPKIACKILKYALESSQSTTHRGDNYLAFFKSAFGVFC
jgi:hypothetical protein